MNFPAEWASRRGSFGSQSRGSLGSGSPGSGPASRSLSPEDPSRDSRQLPDGGVFPFADGLPEPAADFRMLGYDDDEDQHQSDGGSTRSRSDSETERNVVASTLQESNAGAFVMSSGSPLSFAQLGMAAALLEGTMPRASEAGSVFGPSSPGSKTGSQAASPRTFSSPLIAQLNPFLSPPPLQLPDAVEPMMGAVSAHSGARVPDIDTTGGASTPHGEAGPGSLTAPLATSAVGSGVVERGADVTVAVDQASAGAHHLLVEMGDLVCKLQQRHELSLTQVEIPTENLLARLAHFREVAESSELRPPLYST